MADTMEKNFVGIKEIVCEILEIYEDEVAGDGLFGEDFGADSGFAQADVTRSRKREEAMSNPFEDDDMNYRVLVNDENQHSLWPEFVAIPAGWTEMYFGPRQQCLEYVEKNWVDMRPRSLIEAMNNSSS